MYVQCPLAYLGCVFESLILLPHPFEVPSLPNILGLAISNSTAVFWGTPPQEECAYQELHTDQNPPSTKLDTISESWQLFPSASR